MVHGRILYLYRQTKGLPCILGIKWYVDGELKASATKDLPHTPGKIFMNIWNNIGLEEWAGKYLGADAKAEYDWVKYTPGS